MLVRTECTKTLDADSPSTYWRVAINTASQFHLGVVDVNPTQVLQADNSIKAVHHGIPARLRANVVARAVHVCGVNAHADTSLVRDSRDDLGDLLETRTDLQRQTGRGGGGGDARVERKARARNAGTCNIT